MCGVLQANGNLGQLSSRLKQSETQLVEFQKRTEELTASIQNTGGENQRLQAELLRLKALVQELQDKNDAFARENKQLSGQ